MNNLEIPQQQSATVEDRSELNNAYNETLYGHLDENTRPEDHLRENPSLNDVINAPGDQDSSDPLFTKAAEIAFDNNRTLEANKNQDSGFMTVKLNVGGQEVIVQRTEDWYMDNHPGTPRSTLALPPESININGVTGVQQKILVEVSPNNWQCQVKNTLQSGSEADLPMELRSGSREPSQNEVATKDSIFNHANINPDLQRNLNSTAAAPEAPLNASTPDVGHAASHDTAHNATVDKLTQEAYSLAT